MANLLKIGNTDLSSYVSGIKVDKNYLSSEYSGRSAGGTSHIDVIAVKYKIYVTFRALSVIEAKSILDAIEDYASLSVTFMDPFKNQASTAICYTSTPSVEYYRLSNNMKLVKPFTINFIEM